ncbi:MAG: hypothetical protein V4666_10055 [Bacteroidota bacterium]
MNEKTRLSNFKLILIGQLFVNIPVVLIIIGSLVLFNVNFQIEYLVSLILAVAIGWVYWGFAIRLWIKWALVNNFDENKLLDLGVSWKLLWRFDKVKIDKIVLKLKEKS